MKHKYITIEGNIGSGKTSLAKQFAKDFNGTLILEAFADNPFLPKFYENPQQYAFPLELFFLAERYQQLKTVHSQRDLFKNFIVSDYLLTKSLLFAKINLTDDENTLFKRLFDIINLSIPQPQLTVYLYNTVENLLKNISKRGREYEKNIKGEYLEKIQQSYLQYFKNLDKQYILIVDTSNMNFVDERKDYETMLRLIDAEYTPGVHYITP